MSAPMQSVKKGRKRGFIMNTFIKGIVVVLPIIILLFFMSIIFNILLKILGPISKLFTLGDANPEWIANFMALGVLVSLIFVIGMIFRSRVGRFYIDKIEDVYLAKIPLYSTVRDTIDQFAELKEMPFSKAVLIDPYGTGAFMTGFVTEEMQDLYTVFVPTAPNPTNGLIFHIPKTKTKPVNVGSELAMRTVISLGTGSRFLFEEDHPELNQNAQKVLDQKKKKRRKSNPYKSVD